MEQKPLLSIGIIFKNEIRCLERCVKSLQPVRDAVPCELVMADTGSEDGSREVAEKYADILFDFPWINDFSAARNAVMDRCSGEWFFFIDADEWLDKDVEELTAFLQSFEQENWDACGMMEWNLYSEDINGGYSTFIPVRMVRMSTGTRFQGAIHEHWDDAGLKSKLVLAKTILYHDGYVAFSADGVQRKRERNMTLLREELAKDPDRLLTLLQFIESGGAEADFLYQMRRAMTLVKEKAPGWDTLGPSFLRYAVRVARERKLPEMEDWIALAEERYLDSFFVRIDAAFEIAAYYLEEKKFDACVRWAETGLKGHEDFRARRGDLSCMVFGALQMGAPLYELGIRIVLARAYFESGRQADALNVFSNVDYALLDARWTANMVEMLHMFQHRSELDLSSIVTAFWNGINEAKPDEKRAEARRAVILEKGAAVCSMAYRKEEEKSEGYRRHVYTLYAPLTGRCVLGDAAAILESESAGEIAGLLGGVEDLEKLPPPAIAHAIREGAAFPDRPLTVEAMDRIISRLAQDREELLGLIKSPGPSLQALTWTRGLLLAAVKVFDWKEPEAGMALARTFAEVEGRFVSRCYAPEMLTDAAIWALPPMHRFGWYCAGAFAAKDAGRAAECVRLLRKGLETAPEMKPMVEFLLEQIETGRRETVIAAAPPELLELAGKVKAILEGYPPDDPSVRELKKSSVYQKVAYLIEEPAMPGAKGIKQ